MPSYIDLDGNYAYVRAGYRMSDTHGADYSIAECHKAEFEEICNEIIDDKLKQLTSRLEQQIPALVEQYGQQVWEKAIISLVGALQTDVKSQVNIALDNAEDIFHGAKAQKYISDNIMKTILKEIDKIKIDIK